MKPQVRFASLCPINFSAINFPWIGRNPYQQARLVWLFAFLLSLTIAVVAVAVVVRHAWWAALIPLLYASMMGLAFLPFSLAVRKAMRRLERSVPSAAGGEADDEFRANGYVVKNMFRTPGVIVVRGDRLVLVPMVGKRVEVELALVRSATEKRWFNGNLLMGGARGFWLEPGSAAGKFWRLGVAVPNPAAFRAALERHRVPLG
jgi:hypothetical protein